MGVKIQESSVLISLLGFVYFLARSRTVAEVKRRWVMVKGRSLSRIGLAADIVKKIIAYLDTWLDEDSLHPAQNRATLRRIHASQ